MIYAPPITIRSLGVVSFLLRVVYVVMLSLGVSYRNVCVEASLPFNTNLLLLQVDNDLEFEWYDDYNPFSTKVNIVSNNNRLDISFDDALNTDDDLEEGTTVIQCSIHHSNRPICDNCTILFRGRIAATVGPTNEGTYPHAKILNLIGNLNVNFTTITEIKHLVFTSKLPKQIKNERRSTVHETSFLHIQNVPNYVSSIDLDISFDFYRHSYIQFTDLEVLLMESTPALPSGIVRTPIPYDASQYHYFPGTVHSQDQLSVSKVILPQDKSEIFFTLMMIKYTPDNPIRSIVLGGSFFAPWANSFATIQLSCPSIYVGFTIEHMAEASSTEVARELSYKYDLPSFQHEFEMKFDVVLSFVSDATGQKKTQSTIYVKNLFLTLVYGESNEKLPNAQDLTNASSKAALAPSNKDTQARSIGLIVGIVIAIIVGILLVWLFWYLRKRSSGRTLPFAYHEVLSDQHNLIDVVGVDERRGTFTLNN